MIFLLVTFIWALWGFGCLSASFTMEKMKTKTSRTSMLMIPATPLRSFSRWFVFTVVYLAYSDMLYKLADYTRFTIYFWLIRRRILLLPNDLSHLVGDENIILYAGEGWNLESADIRLFLVQSLFVLGSSIWP